MKPQLQNIHFFSSKQEHVNIFCFLAKGVPRLSANSYNNLIYISEIKQRLPRHYPRCWRPHSSCCHPVWKTFERVYATKRVQKIPVLTCAEGKRMAPFSIWSLLSQCGRTCACLQHKRAEDKRAYEKRQMVTVTLLGGPASTLHIKPVRDYFCILSLFFFLVTLIYGPIKYQS